MKKNLLYFSDSTFFSGSQNMIINFLESSELNNDYNIFFAYVYSELYEKGLHDRLTNNYSTLFPISLVEKIVLKPGHKNLFNKIYKAFVLLFNKYYSLIINTYLLYNFLKSKNFDIVHINNGGFPGGTPCNAMVIASKLNKINNIFYVVNNTPEGYTFFMRWFDYFIDRLIIKSVTKFITGSLNSLKIMENKLNVPKHKLSHIFNGINPRKKDLDNKTFLKLYSICEESFKISIVGNVEKRKGHIILLKSLKKMIDDKFDSTPLLLIAIGKINPELDNILHFIEKHKLENNVIILPYEINIFNLYSITNTLIVPSIGSEDLPNVISEAMSLGVPVIGTSIAGIPEQVVHNKTGIIVAANDCNNLSNAIKIIIQNKSLLKEFSKNSKIRFNEHFNVNSSVLKYRNLYKKNKL